MKQVFLACIVMLLTLPLLAQKKEKKLWVSALRELYEKTHSPDVREMIAQSKKVQFIAVTLKDTSNLQIKQYVLNESMPAWQMGDSLYVKILGDSSSSFYKGLTYFHELQHSKVRPVLLYDYVGHSKEERRVYAMQNTLLLQLGGERYQKFLDNEVWYVTLYMNHVGKNDLDLLPRHLSERPNLDYIFGPSLSRAERYVRESMFWIHVIMEYLARNMKADELENAQAYFLQNLYQKEIYILQPLTN